MPGTLVIENRSRKKSTLCVVMPLGFGNRQLGANVLPILWGPRFQVFGQGRSLLLISGMLVLCHRDAPQFVCPLPLAVDGCPVVPTELLYFIRRWTLSRIAVIAKRGNANSIAVMSLVEVQSFTPSFCFPADAGVDVAFTKNANQAVIDVQDCLIQYTQSSTSLQSLPRKPSDCRSSLRSSSRVSKKRFFSRFVMEVPPSKWFGSLYANWRYPILLGIGCRKPA